MSVGFTNAVSRQSRSPIVTLSMPTNAPLETYGYPAYRNIWISENDAESKVGAISDEFKHREKMRHLAQEKQRKELEQVRSNMNTAKVLEMKKQANLKSELINAYKIGDQEKRKQLQRRLEPDDPRGRC